ncbi:MAG: putative metal-binding motif-containing protein [Polyangiaceae bacterium]|nr:putative metal-binding motif-containing protein [Polyangiaceae bacterium]
MRARFAFIAATLLSSLSLAVLFQGCDGGGGFDENADNDEDGFKAAEDCDDYAADVNPDATEPCACDGLDNDCNGKVDDFECGLVCYPPIDSDGDGFEPPADCNDQDPTVNPAAMEPCECDTVDQDCSGDSQDFACDLICYDDDDNDGYDTQTDCDDGNDSINPGANEACECDQIDQNCNKSITDFPGGDCTITCTDNDGDGFFGEGDDCNDNDDTVFPGAAEKCECDAVDQDCSGDSLDFDCDLACPDADNDGVPEGPDCDDGDPNSKPSDMPEACACDGTDNNCNGTVDDFDGASCTKMCTYLAKGDMCTPGMEPACGANLACCSAMAGDPTTCIDKCVGAMCAGGCPMP